jgi:hypothetical protein
VEAHGRHTVFVDEAVSAEHAADQTRRMVTPVDKVGAGDVSPAVAVFILEDVKQVIATFPEDGAIDIEWRGPAFHRDKMVPRPIPVPQKFFPKGPAPPDHNLPLQRRIQLGENLRVILHTCGAAMACSQDDSRGHCN